MNLSFMLNLNINRQKSLHFFLLFLFIDEKYFPILVDIVVNVQRFIEKTDSSLNDELLTNF